MPEAELNGIRLYYEEHGRGASILCIHGTSGSAVAWPAAVENLARLGRVIVYDRRGSGRSERPNRYERTSVAEHADDAAGLLDALAGQVGFRWRIELRRLELLARLDDGRAEELLEAARAHGSPKYEALALRHLGRAEDAAAVGARTRSPYLLARVASPPQARQAFGQIAARLEPELQELFTTQSPLASLL